jgi:hypothetical protein
MKKNLLTIFSVGTFLLTFTLVTFAQESQADSPKASKYVISAEAGGVNFVEGKVAIARKIGRTGLLLKGDSVKIGDRVSTDETSKAEVLLNPGSYIRVGGNSSFEFIDTSLENLKINLIRGSAIFEVITSDGFTFSVNTPKASFNVVKSGVYRIDVLEDGHGKIEVWNGKAQIGDDDNAIVKKGKTATTGGDTVAVAKFDRGERDSFEDWSRQRAKELAKANDRLERNSLRNTLISGFNSSGWNLYDSFGLWVYDPFWGSFCFLPFGYGWSSPYGYSFGRDLWYYRLPQYVYYPPVRVNTPNNNPTGTVNNPNNSGGPTREVRPVLNPPYQRVDRDNGRGREREDVDFPGSFPTRRTSPTVFPSQSTPTKSTDSETTPVNSPVNRKEKP